MFSPALSIDIIVQTLATLLLPPSNHLGLVLPKTEDGNSSIMLKYLDFFLKHVGSIPPTPKLSLFIDELVKGILRECGRVKSPVPDERFTVLVLIYTTCAKNLFVHSMSGKGRLMSNPISFLKHTINPVIRMTISHDRSFGVASSGIRRVAERIGRTKVTVLWLIIVGPKEFRKSRRGNQNIPGNHR